MGVADERDETVMISATVVAMEVCSLPRLRGTAGRGCLRSETPPEEITLTRVASLRDLSRKRERCTELARGSLGSIKCCGLMRR